MLPAIIEYLMSLRLGQPGIYCDSYQIIMPNFPALQSISYQVLPLQEFEGYILYEWTFGQAMVPHAFDCKMYQRGNKLFDAVISGRFTSGSVGGFSYITRSEPLDVAVTNLRVLTNYFEMTNFYLVIPTLECYNEAIDALRRMHTSAEVENLLRALTAGGGGGGS